MKAFRRWAGELVADYPARSAGVATAIVTIGIYVGHPVDADLAGLIVGTVGTVLSFLVHTKVTPTKNI